MSGGLWFGGDCGSARLMAGYMIFKVSSNIDSVISTFSDHKYIAFFWYSTSQRDFENIYKC